MGLNQQSAQPSAYNQNQSLTPQQQMQLLRLRGLQSAATTPYTGNAPNGAAAQGIAQLVSALLANKAAGQMKNQWANQQGIPTTPNSPGSIAPQALNQQQQSPSGLSENA